METLSVAGMSLCDVEINLGSCYAEGNPRERGDSALF